MVDDAERDAPTSSACGTWSTSRRAARGALLDDDGIAALLAAARRIAVIGASSRPGRPSLGVMRTLLAAGYEVVPVNPNERSVLGLDAYPDLASAVSATGPVDIVDVFRRAELCVPHAREAVEAGARCLWLQLGIVDVEAARIAHGGGAVGRDGPLHGDRGAAGRPRLTVAARVGPRAPGSLTSQPSTLVRRADDAPWLA